jgi:WD40 repeat protein
MVYFAEMPYLLWPSPEAPTDPIEIDFLDSDEEGTVIAIHQNGSVRFLNRATGLTSASSEPLLDLSGAESLLSPVGGSAVCLDQYSAQIHQIRASKDYRLSISETEAEQMTAFCFSADGSTLYIGTGAGSVWQHKIGSRKAQFLYSIPPVSTIRFGPHVSFSNLDSEVRNSSLEIADVLDVTANEFSLSLGPAELREVAAFLGRMAELQQEVRVSALLSTAPSIIGLSMNSDDRLIITTQEGTVLEVDVTDGLVSFKSLATVGRLLGATSSSTGRYLSVYEESGRVSLVDCSTGGIVCSPYERDLRFEELMDESDDDWDEDEDDEEDEDPDSELPDDELDVLVGPPVIGFSADDRLVAFGNCDGNVEIYDLTGEQPSHVNDFPAHSGAIVEILLLSLDDGSNAVVTLGIDGMLKAWSTAGNPIETYLSEMQGNVSALGRVGRGSAFALGNKSGEVFISTIVASVDETDQ